VSTGALGSAIPLPLEAPVDVLPDDAVPLETLPEDGAPLDPPDRARLLSPLLEDALASGPSLSAVVPDDAPLEHPATTVRNRVPHMRTNPIVKACTHGHPVAIRARKASIQEQCHAQGGAI
jgi:hypothetical protein